MTTLTMEMLLDAKRRLGAPPPRQQIRCGNLDEFMAAIERQTGQSCVKTSKITAIFGGVEVVVSRSVPVDKAVVFEGGMIKSIIDLREGEG